MTTFSRLIAAATLISATALAPGLAHADDRRGRDDRDDRRQEAVRPEQRDQRQDERFERREEAARDGWRGREQEERFERRTSEARRPSGAREQMERLEQVRRVRWELSELERDRAEARARFADRPWQLASYEDWYLARHDRLTNQLQQLSWYAWR